MKERQRICLTAVSAVGHLHRDEPKYSCQRSAGCLDHCYVKERWQMEVHQLPRGHVEAAWPSM